MNLRARLIEIETELRSLDTAAGNESLTAEQQERWDALMVERGTVQATIADEDRLAREAETRRAAERAAIRSLVDQPGHVEPAVPPADPAPQGPAQPAVVPAWRGQRAPHFVRSRAPFDGAVSTLSRSETRSRALTVLEREQDVPLASENLDRLARMVDTVPAEDDDGHVNFDGHLIAQRILLTESPEYRSAFQKYMRYGVAAGLRMTPEEQRAVARFGSFESRAASEGTNSAGGFGVPVIIDPTIILTSGAAAAPILNAARVETITNNVWKGVSSQGMSWATAAEGAAASDNTPTLAQPTVTAYRAQGFIPYSIEVAMDYPNFAAEMAKLIEQGYIDYLATKTATGSGSSDLRGIFTAIAANTNTQVVTTTDGAFGGVDVFKTWNALAERYRGRASWAMSVSVESAIRQFAAAAGSSSAYFTVDLTGNGISNINGRPVLRTDYAPSFTGSVPGTTGGANILVVGDFSNYLVAQRAGMSVEQIPMLFDVTNNRPTGQRGWYAWARVGADSINDIGFRLLLNT